MKRRIATILCIILSISLYGCGACKHEEWKEATCTEPKTCVECGATDGEPLGHKWKDATYNAPQTCSRCGETKGSALPLPTYRWNQTTRFDNFDVAFDNTNDDPYKYGFVIVGSYDNFDDLVNGFKREVGDSRLDKLIYVMKHTIEYGEHLSYGDSDYYFNDNWDTNCKLELLVLTQGSVTVAELFATKEEGITHYCPEIFK